MKPIYEVLMQLKGMPYLPPQPEGFLRHVTVKECCGRPPVTLHRVERVRMWDWRRERKEGVR